MTGLPLLSPSGTSSVDGALRAARAAVRVGRTDGAAEVLRRVVRKTGDRLGAWSPDGDFDAAHLADSTRLDLPRPSAPPPRTRPLRIGFVTTPPALGSGGHTTMFRFVAALEAQGHECVLFLYDRWHGDLAEQTAVLRKGWPWMRAEARRVEVGPNGVAGLCGVDAAVASGWQTAHVLARSSAPMERLYLIQDYEPFFYPRGSTYALAEDTYRFGFHHIAVGTMVEAHLRTLGVPVEPLPFGCDTSVYGLVEPPVPRRGVVFFARPGADRRGFALATLALEQFHRRCPDEPIHVYGQPRKLHLPFPVVDHGRLTPEDLNRLYNRAVAGIGLSFTNISLVVAEMLAAGVVPVVNDMPESHGNVTPGAEVAWVPPTAGAVADRLVELVRDPDPDRPSRVAASVLADDWRPARHGFVDIVERVTYQTAVR